MQRPMERDASLQPRILGLEALARAGVTKEEPDRDSVTQAKTAYPGRATRHCECVAGRGDTDPRGAAHTDDDVGLVNGRPPHEARSRERCFYSYSSEHTRQVKDGIFAARPGGVLSVRTMTSVGGHCGRTTVRASSPLIRTPVSVGSRVLCSFLSDACPDGSAFDLCGGVSGLRPLAEPCLVLEITQDLICGLETKPFPQVSKVPEEAPTAEQFRG